MTQEKPTPLLVRVVDRRAAMATAARAKEEPVQIPAHDNCPQPSTLTTILTAVAGVLTALLAWFKEPLFGLQSKQREEWDTYKKKVDALEQAHNKEEQAKLIKEQVEQRLSELLKQPRTQESR